jgi:hypothetical protein
LRLPVSPPGREEKQSALFDYRRTSFIALTTPSKHSSNRHESFFSSGAIFIAAIFAGSTPTGQTNRFRKFVSLPGSG